MPTRLSGLCRRGVGVTPFSNSAVAILCYAGDRIIGQSRKPPYAQRIEEAGGIRINPAPEEDRLREQSKVAGVEVRRDEIEKYFRLALSSERLGEIEKTEQLCQRALPYSRDMMEAYEAGELPRVIILACNPDELWAYAYEIAGLWERFVADGQLSAKTTPKEIEDAFPLFAPACNGIVMGVFFGFLDYRIRQSEAIMRVFSSLPNQGEAAKLALLSTILRLGPYQAGNRYLNEEGELVYKPGGIDHLEVAGGSLRTRAMVKEMIDSTHATYRRWIGLPPAEYLTRQLSNPHLMDYLKAMMTVNINGAAIVQSRRSGSFEGVTMGKMLDRHVGEMRSYSRALYDIAQRSGYMGNDPIDFETEFSFLKSTLRKNYGHKTSSVRGVELALKAGRLSPQLGPNEVALFNPAICRARQLEMHPEADRLTGLRDKVQETLEALAA